VARRKTVQAADPPDLTARASRDKLLHDAGIGSWRYDPDAETFQFSAELLDGYDAPPAGVPKAMVDALVHPDDLAVEQPLRERLTREGGAAEMELRMVDPAGGWRHVRILMRSGARQPSGRFEMYGLTQPVTELAKARDEARGNAERLRLALNAAQAGAFEIDMLSRELACSPEFVALAGRPVSFEEFAAKGLRALHPDNPAVIRWLAGEAAEDRGYEAVDVLVARPDGDRWMRICCNIERDAELRPERVVGLMFDIDERKRQELELVEAQRVAQEATVAKSAFLASVSHEIRTPMNGIVGVLHLLKRERLSDEGRRLLEDALACSGMLAQLIDDVLDFSKIEAGKLQLAPEPIRIAEAVDGVVELLRPQARAGGLYLNVEMAAELDWVMLDPVRIRQCLFNLIGNGVKFTREGGVDVRVSRIDSERLRFEVADSGVGIPKGAQARLFDRFEQVDSSTTRNFRGTGLGLAITRSLAELMGGQIAFESEENIGSTFWLEIPAPAVAAPLDAGPTSVEAEVLEGLRVLVVDDNATNRLVASKIVESLGAGAVAVDDGPGAIEAVRCTRFDLILMDVNMPGMDGMEATRRIRGLGGETGVTPVIALTANVMAHQRKAYLAAGMDGMVPKPFSPAALLAEIGRLLSVRAEYQAAIRASAAS